MDIATLQADLEVLKLNIKSNAKSEEGVKQTLRSCQSLNNRLEQAGMNGFATVHDFRAVVVALNEVAAIAGSMQRSASSRVRKAQIGVDNHGVAQRKAQAEAEVSRKAETETK